MCPLSSGDTRANLHERLRTGRRAQFVPICAASLATGRDKPRKCKMAVMRHLSGESEVAHYQTLTAMIRIPSLAPIHHLRHTAPNHDKPRHLQGFSNVPSLRSVRQLAPRFDRLRLKFVCVFMYTLRRCRNFFSTM